MVTGQATEIWYFLHFYQPPSAMAKVAWEALRALAGGHPSVTACGTEGGGWGPPPRETPLRVRAVAGLEGLEIPRRRKLPKGAESQRCPKGLLKYLCSLTEVTAIAATWHRDVKARGRPHMERVGGRHTRPRGAEEGEQGRTGRQPGPHEKLRDPAGPRRTRGEGNAAADSPRRPPSPPPPRPAVRMRGGTRPPPPGRWALCACAWEPRSPLPSPAGWGAGRRARAMAGPSLRPHVHWAQRHRELYLRVELSDVQVPGGACVTHSRTHGEGAQGCPAPRRRGGVRGA